MPGCGAAITIYVPTRYSCKEIPFTCGMTGHTGNPEFCDKCAPKYAHRDWQAEAEEAGEQWDDDY